MHHHENMVKSAQHHWLAPGALPHDVLDEILNHTLSVVMKMNTVYFVNYASDLFQVEVSHLYDPKTPQFTLILHIPHVSNPNLLELNEFLPLWNNNTLPCWTNTKNLSKPLQSLPPTSACSWSQLPLKISKTSLKEMLLNLLKLKCQADVNNLWSSDSHRSHCHEFLQCLQSQRAQL